MIRPFNDIAPVIGTDVFIAPDAWVIGDVSLGNNVSVFFGAVIRGDLMPIRIGHKTNIQEHCVIHTTHGRSPTIVGEMVTVGHRAILHGCSIENGCLIGMGAIVLDEAVVGEDCVIAAGSVVTQGTTIPPRSMVMGVPARVVRSLTEEELKSLPQAAQRYVGIAEKYRKS